MKEVFLVQKTSDPQFFFGEISWVDNIMRAAVFASRQQIKDYHAGADAELVNGTGRLLKFVLVEEKTK
jgi:hypothetical protein